MLGSYDGCDLYIPGDKEIRPQHAQVRVEKKQFIIESLGAEGGLVYLATPGGPRAVERHALKEGDAIELGRTRMIFEAEGGG